jgi:hypothetical protein
MGSGSEMLSRFDGGIPVASSAAILFCGVQDTLPAPEVKSSAGGFWGSKSEYLDLNLDNA